MTFLAVAFLVVHFVFAAAAPVADCLVPEVARANARLLWGHADYGWKARLFTLLTGPFVFLWSLSHSREVLAAMLAEDEN